MPGGANWMRDGNFGSKSRCPSVRKAGHPEGACATESKILPGRRRAENPAPLAPTSLLADPVNFPAEFQKVRVPSLRHAYAKALKLALAEQKVEPPPARHTAVDVAFEAAQALVRLEKARKVAPEEQAVLKDARATISLLEEQAAFLRERARARGLAE